MSANVLKAIAVTAELTGTELSATALRVMGDDLKQYQEQAVIHALVRCRRELSGRLTLAAIIERLSEHDGRPSADEAWATALDAMNEAETVVWTNEAQQAFAIARPVLKSGDKTGARMAFRDAYERIVRDNREHGKPCTWSASLGWDKERQAVALKRAESSGLLPSSVVAGLLPNLEVGAIGNALFGGKALPAPEGVDDDFAERIAEVKKILAGKVSA